MADMLDNLVTIAEKTETIDKLILIALAVLIFAGLIALQIYLSRMESRWPGLILPILSFVLSVVLSLGQFLYIFNGSAGEIQLESVGPDGTVITESVPVEPSEEIRGEGGMLVMAVPVFLLANIPTLIYVAIYCGERGKYRRRRQMERMNIQDL